LEIEVPGFDLSEISYLKTITDFNADFTPAERASQSRIQYSDEDIRMIPVFIINLRGNRYDQPYLRVGDIRMAEHAAGIEMALEFANYEYTLGETLPDSLVDRLSELLPDENPDPDDIMLGSLIMGWQMKYRDAIAILDDTAAGLSENYLAAFIRGNHNFAIAEIISSIESQEIYTSEDNSTVTRYYRDAVRDYNRSIELNPDFPYSRFNRAYINSIMDELEPALDDYSSCIGISPDLGQAYYNRGLLNIFLDSLPEGCRDLSQAGELGIEAAYRVIYKFCKE
jgi:tetratricopeptide (TPR) repeat protein